MGDGAGNMKSIAPKRILVDLGSQFCREPQQRRRIGILCVSGSAISMGISDMRVLRGLSYAHLALHERTLGLVSVLDLSGDGMLRP
jgi:hypothetical protein